MELEALEQLAVRLVVALGAQHRVSPHHLALAVPGLCHTHHPSAAVYADCAYCRREGNVYSAPTAAASGDSASLSTSESASGAAAPEDLLARFAGRPAEELAAFGDAVLDAIRGAKHVNVDAVRRSIVDGLRLTARHAAPATAR